MKMTMLLVEGEPLNLNSHSSFVIKVNKVFRLKTYVDDDSGTPHVEAAIVALVPQHFRRKVSRSSDHALPETLFSDDAGETEVAQFYLKNKNRNKLFLWGIINLLFWKV